MEPMIKRVGDAIKDAMHGHEWGDSFDDVARAAIEAMREPTEKMVEAGGLKHWGHDMSSEEADRENVVEIYSAMIDAALTPPAY